MKNSASVKFENLCYNVNLGLFCREQKTVLNGVSGLFQGQQLTAIIGRSGGGKSSLLNALSGYQKSGVSGSITINNQDVKYFKHQIAYVFQECHLHNYLTASESISYAIKFKIGNPLNANETGFKILKILETFGLASKADTLVKYLSGGQMKRLSIAQEIVDDPKIIFLDECTTDLDSVSSMQCINLLRKLADNGHTVICTIHQASSRMLELFDHLYAMNKGECIYQGNFKNLVPFMRECGIECPQTYNPADYLLEICDFNEIVDTFVSESRKKNIRQGQGTIYKSEKLSETEYISHYLTQLLTLFSRNLTIMRRDYNTIVIRLLSYLGLGLLIGSTFHNVGNDASSIFRIFRLMIAFVLALTYTGMYSQVTVFHQNFSILKRECFNRWYTPTIFNIVLQFVDIPILSLAVLLFVAPIYIFSNQPHDVSRFSILLLLSLLVSFNSQNMGLLGGWTRGALGGLVFVILVMILEIAFSGVVTLEKDAPSFLHTFFYASYLKYTFDGVLTALLGFNRTKLECSEVYCHYQSPKKFLEFLDINQNLETIIIVLVGYMIILRIIAWGIMSYRLKAK